MTVSWDLLGVSIALGVCGCTVELDAGSMRPRGLLPVDERNPIVLVNDGPYDNWQGEYAVLLASSGGPELAGIVVNANYPWPDLEANVAGWRELVTAARASGLANVPDPLASVSSPLTRPESGKIEDTAPNRSEGALFIVRAATELGFPYRPLAIVTGGRLTDVADAYLLDPTVADRVVVVSSLGEALASGGAMGNPNGEMDPWADLIVSTRFRYVQVSAFYDQLADVPDARVAELPSNAFGAWMSAKQPSIFDLPEAADQVAVLAAGFPRFVVAVERVAATEPPGPLANAGPELVPDSDGRAWLVTESAAGAATTRLWELLTGPSVFRTQTSGLGQ